MNNGHVQTAQSDASQPNAAAAAAAAAPTTKNGHSNLSAIRANARVEITEQPASKALRFRYECEGRSAGSIPGASSSGDTKTYPSIRIVGYKGRAVVVVSCVTKDAPHRPHPHNLVGKEGCKKGVCTVEINNDTMSVSFSNLGIQCVKKRDIEEALRCREEIRVDPFRTGFSHRSQPSSIDLNSVRLCFQVFLESEVRGRFTVPMVPVVSEPIFDKKAMSDLVICKLSDASGSVAGGRDMILLCEKVAKEDISVRFYEESADGTVVWEGLGDFQHANVHKQVAISFRTPRYKNTDIDRSVNCFVQLRRPSDGITSESLPFEYYPMESDTTEGKRKRPRIQSTPGLLYSHKPAGLQPGHVARNIVGNAFDCVANPMDETNAYIKSEPRDTLSPHQQRLNNYSPLVGTSPMHPSPAGSPYYNYNNPQQHSPYTPNILCDQQLISPANNNNNIANNNMLQPIMGGTFFAQQPNAPLNDHNDLMQFHQLEQKSFHTVQSVAVPIMPYEVQADQKPNNIPTTMQQQQAVAADTTDGINLSGLLRDLDSNMQFSGELGLSLSFLEGAAGGSLQAQMPQPAATNAPAMDCMEPENMTDSFNKFNLQN